MRSIKFALTKVKNILIMIKNDNGHDKRSFKMYIKCEENVNDWLP